MINKHITIIALRAFLLLCVSNTIVQAQGEQEHLPYLRIGLFTHGITNTLATSDIAGLPNEQVFGMHSLRGKIGYSAGVLVEYPLLPSLSFGVRAGYQSIGTSFTRDTVIYSSVQRANQSPELLPVAITSTLDVNQQSFFIQPHIHIAVNNFSVFGGVAFGLGASSNAVYSINADISQEYRIGENTKRLLDSSYNENMQMANLPIAATLELAYQISLAADNSVHLAPEMEIQYALNSVSQRGDWKNHTLRAGLRLSYDLFAVEHDESERLAIAQEQERLVAEAAEQERRRQEQEALAVAMAKASEPAPCAEGYFRNNAGECIPLAPELQENCKGAFLLLECSTEQEAEQLLAQLRAIGLTEYTFLAEDDIVNFNYKTKGLRSGCFSTEENAVQARRKLIQAIQKANIQFLQKNIIIRQQD